MGEEVKMTEYDNCDAGANGNARDDDRVFEWESGLPNLDDLTPLSQPLISPELASAFSISPEPSKTLLDVMRASQNTLASLRGNSAQSQGFSSNNNNFKSFTENCEAAAVAEQEEEADRLDSRKLRKTVAVDSSTEEADSALRTEASADDPSARTLKRPRLVWTPQLHKRFVDVVAHLGIKNAVPKTIMQLMNVEGLTRENVASHLQKYRLYLKRMQGLSTEGPSSSDPLFASTPVPQSLHESGGNGNGHVHGHGHGHGHGHVPAPVPMPYGPPPPQPPMMHMPVYGMAHGPGHMGMQMGGQGGFEGNPYMMQQREWSGNRFGSVLSYPHAAAPNDK